MALIAALLLTSFVGAPIKTHHDAGMNAANSEKSPEKNREVAHHKELSPPNKGRTGVIVSLLPTLAAVISGGLTLTLAAYDGGSVTGMVAGFSLLGLGVSVGPSSGHFYIGNHYQAWLGLIVRALFVGAAATAWFLLTEQKNEIDFIIQIGATTACFQIAAGYAIYDIATVQRAAAVVHEPIVFPAENKAFGPMIIRTASSSAMIGFGFYSKF